MSGALVVVCHPDEQFPATVALKARGYWYLDVVPDPGMPHGVAVVWFGSQPQILDLLGRG